jgi:parvulin-like peptidyl-prolyl isomerase
MIGFQKANSLRQRQRLRPMLTNFIKLEALQPTLNSQEKPEESVAKLVNAAQLRRRRKMFKRKKTKSLDKVEARFQQAVDLFKDLDKREFKRLMDGIQLTWEGYNKIRQVQTVDEKFVADIATNNEEEIDFKEM